MKSDKKVAIVTGASSGIGLATAKLFADKGYVTYGLSRRKMGAKDFIEIQVDLLNEPGKDESGSDRNPSLQIQRMFPD